jgi:hypothetical protein
MSYGSDTLRTMTSDAPTALEQQLRDLIQRAIGNGADADAISYVLIRMIPGLIDRRRAHALVVEIFDAYHRAHAELDPERTTPFQQVEFTAAELRDSGEDLLSVLEDARAQIVKQGLVFDGEAWLADNADDERHP